MLFFALAAGAFACGAAPSAGATPSAKAVPIGTFAGPVYIAAAPGQPRLLFVVEQAGEIQVMRDEQKLGHPFLDIRNLVLASPDAGAGGEQGLLSLAFPPDYAQSGRFYVAFNNNHGDVEIDEYRRSATDATQALGASRRILLVIPHPGAQNHNGGQLQFGPDGLLYISVGDGGNPSPSGADGLPARNVGTLLGKILRISPLPIAGHPYGIPQTNPFVDKLGRDEIFALGLRNPWRFSFDGSLLAIADVGQSRQEEVDFLPVSKAIGDNFGWPQYEGNLIYRANSPGSPAPTFPIFTYDHSGGRCAIIGGYVVHDPGLPALAGRYLYADDCDGVLRSFVPRMGTPYRALGDLAAGPVLPGISGFGRGLDGRIYVAQVGGTVSRLAAP